MKFDNLSPERARALYKVYRTFEQEEIDAINRVFDNAPGQADGNFKTRKKLFNALVKTAQKLSEEAFCAQFTEK